MQEGGWEMIMLCIVFVVMLALMRVNAREGVLKFLIHTREGIKLKLGSCYLREQIQLKNPDLL